MSEVGADVGVGDGDAGVCVAVGAGDDVAGAADRGSPRFGAGVRVGATGPAGGLEPVGATDAAVCGVAVGEGLTGAGRLLKGADVPRT